jgi:cyclopropane fatty-acyl-phospholipid synthase-like methyltransferase
MTEEKLNQFAQRTEEALKEAAEIIKREGISAQSPVFDLRAKLYGIALEMSPNARQDDVDTMHKLIKPKKGEVCIDVAAGTGFLTRHLVEWTDSAVYAVDPSKDQLDILRKNIPSEHIRPIVGSLAQETTSDKVGILDQIKEQVDFITSFGGIHHVYYQKKFIEHVEKLLKSGGRFVVGDVGADTALSKHFDDVVTRKCLTSHTARWLSKERLEELISDLPSLTLVKAEMKTQHWVFSSKREMAIFFKGLHAYNVPEDEVLYDLYDTLGYIEKDGQVILSWPMLFFEIVKK